MKKAKFKTKSPALAKLEKMCVGWEKSVPSDSIDLTQLFEMAYRLKREREATIQTDQQSFAA